MNQPRLCYRDWPDGSRTYTSSVVADKYAALYGEPKDVPFVRTNHPFVADAMGEAIVPSAVSQAKRKS